MNLLAPASCKESICLPVVSAELLWCCPSTCESCVLCKSVYRDRERSSSSSLSRSRTRVGADLLGGRRYSDIERVCIFETVSRLGWVSSCCLNGSKAADGLMRYPLVAARRTVRARRCNLEDSWPKGALDGRGGVTMPARSEHADLRGRKLPNCRSISLGSDE
jgi:hypothetical protein